MNTTSNQGRGFEPRTRLMLRRLKSPLALLALLVVPALVLEDRATSPDVRALCNAVNWVIWIAFAAEFGAGLAIARDRRAFVRHSWFELLIILVSPPFAPDALQGILGLRAFRALRLVRLVRGGALAAIGLRRAKKVLRAHGFHYVIVVAVVATGLGALGIYIVERDYTIKTPIDALWWAVVTVTAVGYGDVNPVSGEGRLIALGLMFVGVGVISIFTASIASWFVGEDQHTETKVLEERLAKMQAQLDEMLVELRAERESRRRADRDALTGRHVTTQLMLTQNLERH
jgi:voltage-gated potassium channel